MRQARIAMSGFSPAGSVGRVLAFSSLRTWNSRTVSREGRMSHTLVRVTPP